MAGGGVGWDGATAVGIATCKVLVLLMTEAWRLSPHATTRRGWQFSASSSANILPSCRWSSPILISEDKDPGQGGLLWVPRVGAGVQHIYTTGGHVDEQVDGRGAPRVRKPPC